MIVLEELARFGVSVAFCEGGIADDPHGRLLVQIQAAVAEFERTKIMERNRRGKLFRARQGTVVSGQAPYGYRKVGASDGLPARLEIFEPEAQVVRQIFEWHVQEGLSVRQLGIRLIQLGIPAPHGGQYWSLSTLDRMLRQHAYSGTFYYNRRSFISKDTQPPKHTAGHRPLMQVRPRSEWIGVAVPAIIDVDTWTRSQAIHQENARFSPRHVGAEKYLLRYLVRCGECGQARAAATKVHDDGHEDRYYACRHPLPLHLRPERLRCTQPASRANELDQLVWAEVTRHLQHPDLIAQASISRLGASATGPADGGPSQLSELKTQLRRLMDAYQAGAITLEMLQARQRPLLDRVDDLERHLARTHQHTSRRTDGAARIAAFAQEVAGRLDRMSFIERQELLRTVLEKVVVTEARVELFFKIPLPPPRRPRGPSPPAAGDGALRSQGLAAGGLRLRCTAVGRPARWSRSWPPSASSTRPPTFSSDMLVCAVRACRGGSLNPIEITAAAGSSGGRSLRVFTSHTSELREHPSKQSFMAAAEAAVMRAGHSVADMEYFTARDSSPADYCAAVIAQSNIYVGIIGRRYGETVSDRPEFSYTELEFELALNAGLPRLIFLISDDSSFLPGAEQSEEHTVRQQAFRSRLVEAGITIAKVASPDELELKLYQALIELGPTPDAPARLAAAQALLASMPTSTLPGRTPLPSGSQMPLAPNPLFVGRRDELFQIASTFRGGDTTVALGQIVAATGIGGMGKTQLAVEFVHQYGCYFAGGVFWLSFANSDQIPLLVAACAGSGAMGLEVDVAGRPVEEQVKLTMGAWQSAVPRLLVFDNCEEQTLLDAWRPSSGSCRVLVTSRRSRWSPTLGVTNLPLDVPPRADSIELLRGYRSNLPADHDALDAIANRLGDLPLALHLAGSYLRTYRVEISLDDYLAELRQPEMIEHASLLGRGLEDDPSPTRHTQDQGLAQTFTLSFSRLQPEQERDRVAVALLGRMGCFAPGEPVPRHLLDTSLQEVDVLARRDGLNRLGALGLVEEDEDSLRMHRLLAQLVGQAYRDPQAQRAVDAALIASGQASVRGDLTGAALMRVMPHLIYAATAAETAAQPERRSGELATAVGHALTSMGLPEHATPWYEHATTMYERILGPDHALTASSLVDLAHIRERTNDTMGAKALVERALAIRERVLGSDHLSTASSLIDMAGILSSEGDVPHALGLIERALAIRERALGPDHLETADAVAAMAWARWRSTDVAVARRLFERVIYIRERELGPSHPDVATALTELSSPPEVLSVTP